MDNFRFISSAKKTIPGSTIPFRPTIVDLTLDDNCRNYNDAGKSIFNLISHSRIIRLDTG